MKALTLKSPWAEHIVYGTKRIENRTWRPPADLHGEVIAIHRGKSVAQPSDYDDPRAREQLSRALMPHPANTAGHIIGTARVAGVAHRDKKGDREAHGGIIPGIANTLYFCRSRWNSAPTDSHAANQVYMPPVPWDDPWWIGPIGWLLDDVRPVAPVPARGMPGLWEVPEGLELVEVDR